MNFALGREQKGKKKEKQRRDGSVEMFRSDKSCSVRWLSLSELCMPMPKCLNLGFEHLNCTAFWPQFRSGFAQCERFSMYKCAVCQSVQIFGELFYAFHVTQDFAHALTVNIRMSFSHKQASIRKHTDTHDFEFIASFKLEWVIFRQRYTTEIPNYCCLFLCENEKWLSHSAYPSIRSSIHSHPSIAIKHCSHFTY